MKMSEFACPWDGCDEVYEKEHHMKLHHANAHGESIAGTTVECAHCGDEKTVRPCLADEYEQHFCNPSCKGAWQSENHTGSDSPAWKGGLITVECEWCDGELERKQVAVAAREDHFCDHGCYASWRSEVFRGENNPLFDPLDVECSYCETPFQKTNNRNTEHHFCTPECQREWWSENFRGDGNPNWQGGRSTTYGPRWTIQRRKALERDGYACVICGAGEEAIGREPHVHHIVPKDEFSSLEAAHQLGNLITLCPRHHQKVEHGSIETPTPASPMTPQHAED